MKNIISLLAVAAITLIGCGDNLKRPDASGKDSKPADAQCSNCPAAPGLGAQIDRMGRPAINTALNHGFDGSASAQTAKTAYNENAMGSTWIGYTPEFAKNLGIIDALDTGVCDNGICEASEGSATCGSDCGSAVVGAGNGCGNQVLYNGGMPGLPPNTMSYYTLAGILSADELALDTSKTTCQFYLAVEFGVAIGGGNSTCGGRTPQYDVIDFTYSLATMGLKGFNLATFDPRVKDGATVHTDLLADFPYLGPPH